MTKHAWIGGVIVCTLLAVGPVAGAQTTSDTRVTVPFSDPSRPGTVRVRLLMGSITVRPGSGRDVIVTSSPGRDDDDDVRERAKDKAREKERDRDEPSTEGMRRLSQPRGVDIQEENNTVSVTASVMSGRTNVTIDVPPATNLVLRTVNGGETVVERINGTVEVNSVNGSIRLTDLGGAVVANTTNGRIVATLRTVPGNTPMSFTSFNGSVDVTLPASAKANLKMRSDRGDVYTDFEVQTRQAPPPARPDANADRDRPRQQRDRDRNRDQDDDPRGRPAFRMEVDRSIYGAINGGGPDIELRTFNGNVYLRRAK